MKKLISLVLTLAMILLVGAAFANTVTVNNALEGETYAAYKMLDLSHQGADGAGGNPTAYRYTVASGWEDFFNTEIASKVFTIDSAGYVTSTVNDDPVWSATSDLSAFAEAARTYAEENNLTVEDTKTVAEKATSVELATGDGYYLITSTLGTRAMIDTTPGNVTINEKNEGNTIEKVVMEDSHGNYGKSNDAQIGDTVEFKSTADIAPRSINVKIHDIMDDGLTLNASSIKVYIDSTLATEYTEATVRAGTGDAAPDNEDTFTIDIPDTFAATAHTSQTLYIVYTAEVNAAAIATDNDGKLVIASQTNTTKISFGDNSSQEDTTTTTTHKFEVLKYASSDSEKAPLANAIFQLKKGTEDTESTEVVNLIKIDDKNYRVADDTETGTAYTHVTANNEVVTIADGTLVSDFVTVGSGKITIWGVDSDHDYVLVELQPPKGYNKAADTDVTVSANDDTCVEVVNNTGAELPSTGGIGNTIFYVIGGILLVGAAIVLVARRKANN